MRGLERMRYGLRQLLEDLAGCQMAPLEVMVVGLAEHALDQAEESGRTQGPRACGCGRGTRAAAASRGSRSES